jgi:TetR/AcrR family transcriptional repressor of nem operon
MMGVIQIQDYVCHPECQGQSSKEGQMGSSQAEKAASHERIVKTAAARVRRDGIDALTVSELMREAGLTHGGFYRHFDSRDDLVAEAVGTALTEGSSRTEEAARIGGLAALTAIVDEYLSPPHRDHPELGCAVGALPGDVARSGTRTRDAYGQQVRRYIDLLADLTTGSAEAKRDEAVLILSALVGALSMARAVNEAELSDELLTRAARALHRQTRDRDERAAASGLSTGGERVGRRKR